jgi:hypothetical protein
MRFSDLPRPYHNGGRSGRRRHVRAWVEVIPSAVSTTRGVEPASLASMAQVTGSVSEASPHQGRLKSDALSVPGG